MCFSWLDWDSLCANFLSCFLGLNLLSIVLSNSFFECLPALTLSHVLNSDMNSLRNNSVRNFLVNDNSDCVLGHVKYLSSSSMVEFVRHTFMNATISNNINEISFSVGCENFGERSGTMVSEALLEKMSGF